MSPHPLTGLPPADRRIGPRRSLRTLVLALLAWTLVMPAAPVAAAPACAPGVELLGYSDALDKTTFVGTSVGGLSALAYDRRRDLYYSLVDNQATTPARLYSLRLPLGPSGLGTPAVQAVTTLTDAAGTAYTGATLDGEGLALTRTGDLLIASETEPSIRRFGPDGRQLGELPVPARYRVAPAGEATRNQTFESLTLSPDGRSLFTAVEGPLAPDATTADGRNRIRILRYDDRPPGSFVPAAEYYYLTDPGLGVVELLAYSARQVIVLERGFVAGVGNTVRLYVATLDGAADVTGEASLARPGLTPLPKELGVDLADCPQAGIPNPGPQQYPLLDNYESLAFGPPLPDGRLSLLLQSDDNFNATQVTRVIALGITPPEPAPRLTPKLLARAVLPADTFAPGPPAGAQIMPPTNNGRTAPFPSQPVQGVSAVLDAGGGSYWAMSDNGFGAKTNSADYLLRVYRVRPAFETAAGGPGTVAVEEFIQLRDPDRRIPFPIVNEASPERLLTGADFDIESLRIDAAGELWFGDEFGPYLLHTDATGRVLEAPFGLAGVKSPQNPTLAPGEAPTLGGSSGFEGMAISPDRRTLYPMLEGAVTADPDRRRRGIFEFDIATRGYTGRIWQYRTDAPGNAIGDLTAVDERRLLVIERDGGQGEAARFKRIFLIDLGQVDADGYLVKYDLLDLLAIPDPDPISLPARPGDIGLGDPFSFPFVTIESILPLEGGRLLIANDNNYPFSAGRNPGRPDDTEFIIVGLELAGLTP